MPRIVPDHPSKNVGRPPMLSRLARPTRGRPMTSTPMTGTLMTDTEAMGSKRIGILVVAYNAASTLAQVLDRIPADFRPRIVKILIGDDASEDGTHLIALGYKQ